MAILSASNVLFRTGGSSIKEHEILEFCESELFQENSEVASSSNCCYDDHSSYTTTNLSFPRGDFSIIFDEELISENSSVNLDFTTSPHLNTFYQLSNQHQLFEQQLTQLQNQNHPLIQQQLPYNPSHEPLPTDIDTSKLNNCSFMEPSYLSLETSRIFNGDLFLGHELDINNGIFCPDPNYNSNELQALGNESQHLVNGGGSSCAAPLASEMITNLDVTVTNKLTTQERKEKIHRYLKKRNHRNFSKKIKYACRKTLADSRPRVRGRFAKNIDDFGENNRGQEDTTALEDDVKSFNVVVKEEDENFESSDIFPHISGLNSFKCNYPIQSWM